MKFLVCVPVLRLTMLCGCTKSEKKKIVVYEKEYGSDWPFNLKQGELDCINLNGGRKAVILRYGNRGYAINGAAMGAAKKLGIVGDKTKLFRRDSDGFYTIGNPEKIIQKGLEICE